MKTLLPAEPYVSPSNAVMSDKPLEFWLPALEHLRHVYHLPEGEWQRLLNGKNIVYTLNEGWIVKLIPPFWSEDANRESAALEAVAGKLLVDTPRLEYTGLLEDWSVLIMSRLSATPLASIWQALTHEQQTRVAFQMGEIAAQLHAVATVDLAALHVDWPTWFWLNDQKREAVADTSLPQSLRESLPDFLESVGALPSANARDVLLHGDVSAGNLLIRDGKIVGLLDFGDAKLGEFTHEFISPASHMFRGNEALLTAFYDGYGLTANERTVRLQHHLITRALLWYGWGYLGSFIPPTMTSWERVAAFFWCMVKDK